MPNATKGSLIQLKDVRYKQKMIDIKDVPYLIKDEEAEVTLQDRKYCNILFRARESTLDDKMAEQQRSSSGSNIQQFIRTVLSAVTNLQGKACRNNEPGSSPQQHSSVQDEISARFTERTS